MKSWIVHNSYWVVQNSEHAVFSFLDFVCYMKKIDEHTVGFSIGMTEGVLCLTFFQSKWTNRQIFCKIFDFSSFREPILQEKNKICFSDVQNKFKSQGRLRNYSDGIFLTIEMWWSCEDTFRAAQWWFLLYTLWWFLWVIRHEQSSPIWLYTLWWFLFIFY